MTERDLKKAEMMADQRPFGDDGRLLAELVAEVRQLQTALAEAQDDSPRCVCGHSSEVHARPGCDRCSCDGFESPAACPVCGRG